jgi:hypothetical protein
MGGFISWVCPRKEVDPPRYESEVEIGAIRNMSSHYEVRYPAHAERKNSSIYNKTHAKMRNMPCFICDKTFDHVETHHYYCEKAFQNAYDWKKFGEHAQKMYDMNTGECIGPKFNWVEVAKNPDIFVDSASNMIVLCKEHHTSGGKGIHHVPYPDWLAQKFVVQGYPVLGY